VLFKQMAWATLSNPHCEWQVVNAIRASQVIIPLALEMTFYFASDKRDEDSGIKIAQDAIFNRLDLDDKLVTELHVRKQIDERNPRLEVALRCLLPAGR